MSITTVAHVLSVLRMYNIYSRNIFYTCDFCISIHKIASINPDKTEKAGRFHLDEKSFRRLQGIFAMRLLE